MITKIDIERFGLFSNYYWKQHILYTEPMFDEALKLFAEKTTKILGFGCGTELV